MISWIFFQKAFHYSRITINQLLYIVWSVLGFLSVFSVFLRSLANRPTLCFPAEKVREIQEKLEAFIEALHKEK